jgi:hypothetical protein
VSKFKIVVEHVEQNKLLSFTKSAPHAQLSFILHMMEGLKPDSVRNTLNNECDTSKIMKFSRSIYIHIGKLNNYDTNSSPEMKLRYHTFNFICHWNPIDFDSLYSVGLISSSHIFCSTCSIAFSDEHHSKWNVYRYPLYIVFQFQ